MKRGWIFLIVLVLLVATVSATQVDQEVFDSLDRDGEANVIVVLKDIVNSNGLGVASVDRLEERKEYVNEKQEEIFKKLKIKKKTSFEIASEEDYDLDLKHQYSVINGFHGKVSKKGLEKLMELGLVEKVYAVKPIALQLDSSIPVINADDVWDYSVNGISINGSGETVCVLDTGVDYTHPALGGCTNETFLNGTCEKVIGGYDHADGDLDPFPSGSYSEANRNHGTHVAGIVASENETYQGVAPGAKIVAMKVFTDEGSGNTAWAISAIDWCVSNSSALNISVITMSIGVTDGGGAEIPYTSYCDSSDSSGFAVAASAAATQGVFVVASAGNNKGILGLTSPSCGENVTSVGGSTDVDGISGYNSASILSVLAPGTDIYSTVFSSSFSSKSGTSMAAPHVAGAGAIITQYWKLAYGVTPTFEQIRTKLRNTGVSINDTRNGIVFPRIDILAAIQPYINFTSSSPANDSTIIVTHTLINITSDVNLSTALLEWNNGSLTNYTMNQSNVTNFYYNISGLSPGSYTYKVYGNDSVGTFGVSKTRTIEVDNTPPNITFYTPLNNSFYGLLFNLNVSVTNLMLSASTYNITNSSGNLTQVNSNLSVSQANFTWSDFVNISNSTFSEGNYTLSVWANDSLGNEDTQAVNFVVDKTYPVINNVSRTPEIVYNNDTVVFTLNVTDIYLNISRVYLESNFTGTWDNYSIQNMSVETFNISVTGSSNLTNQKNIVYKFYTYDYAGNLNSSSTYNFTIQNRNIYFVNITNPINGTVIEVGNLTQFNGTATDPDNDTITYTWVYNGSSTIGENPQLQINSTGTFLIILTASDSYGANLSANISVVVNDTTAPIMSYSSTPSNPHFEEDGENFTIYFNFTEFSNVSAVSGILSTQVLSSSFCTNLGSNFVNCSWPLDFDADDYGDYTIYMNATDGYGNLRSSTYEITLASCSDSIENGDETDVDCGGSCTACVVASSSSGGSGSGGGGAATAATTTTEDTEDSSSSSSSSSGETIGTAALTPTELLESTDSYSGKLSLKKDQEATIKIDKAGLSVKQIKIDSKEEKEVQVEVISYNDTPENVSKLNNVYRYLKINSGLEGIKMNSALIDFEVPLSWLTKHNYSKKEVVLVHYVNNHWDALKTKLILEENSTLKYQAKTKSFSYFAIASKPAQEGFFSKLFSGPISKEKYVLYGLIGFIFLLILVYFSVREGK
jgi:PGF-pre-PGF domain-containing protein